VHISTDDDNNVTILTANTTSSDFDGNTVTLSYRWLKNGTPITGQISQTLNVTTLTLAPNDTITVEVTPNDGTVSGTTGTGTVTIATAAPDPITLQ
jgi:translation initiation factor IF-1